MCDLQFFDIARDLQNTRAMGHTRPKILMTKTAVGANVTLKGNSGQNFFFKKLHSSYRALKCEKNPFCFILITFFVQKLLKFEDNKFS